MKYKAIIDGDKGAEQFHNASDLCVAIENGFSGFVYLRAGPRGDAYTVARLPSGRFSVVYSEEAAVGEPVAVDYASLGDALNDLYHNLAELYENPG